MPTTITYQCAQCCPPGPCCGGDGQLPPTLTAFAQQIGGACPNMGSPPAFPITFFRNGPPNFETGWSGGVTVQPGTPPLVFSVILQCDGPFLSVFPSPNPCQPGTFRCWARLGYTGVGAFVAEGGSACTTMDKTTCPPNFNVSYQITLIDPNVINTCGNLNSPNLIQVNIYQ